MNSLACVSLSLTLFNIICIFLSGLIVLRLKEVTPDKVPQSFSKFWKKDVKKYRKFGKPSKEIRQMIIKESKDFFGIKETDNFGLADTFIQTIFETIERDEDYRRISYLQLSTLDINKQLTTDSRTNNQSYIAKENLTSTAPMPNNSSRSMKLRVEEGRAEENIDPVTCSTLDSKLYHQVELLLKNSVQSINSRQPQVSSINSFQLQRSKTAPTIP